MSTQSRASPAKVIPAQLAFLAIYNPSLGPTDDTFEDQLVFWHSRVQVKKHGRRDADADTAVGGEAGVRAEALREDRNESLRQIGLAQGMVDFAR